MKTNILFRYKQQAFLIATGEERDYNDFINVRKHLKTELGEIVKTENEPLIIESFFEIQKLYGLKGDDRQKII